MEELSFVSMGPPLSKSRLQASVAGLRP